MKTAIRFNKQFDFEYEQVQRLSLLVRRVVARNPNYFTFYGTNSYLVGNGEVALIDPGPDTREHSEAIINALNGERITHIFITHTHFDHWPAYKVLQKRYGAKTYAYSPLQSARKQSAGQSASQRSLATQERFEMTDFVPDVGLEDGETVKGPDWTLSGLFTPGHASDHMCYRLEEEQVLFSGDHVMGWSTSVISPPSGNMKEYMNSLQLLVSRDDTHYWPAHGAGISDPKPYVESFIRHRREREEQILDQIGKGVHTIPQMVAHIYTDIPLMLHPAAERSTLAAMEYLIEKGQVRVREQAANSEYYLNE